MKLPKQGFTFFIIKRFNKKIISPSAYKALTGCVSICIPIVFAPSGITIAEDFAKNKLHHSPVAKKILSIQPEGGPHGHKVRIIADGKIKDYNTFYLLSPPRLVIDIPDVQNSIWYKTLFFESPLIDSIRLGAFYKKKLRVVFDLSPAADLRYRVHSKDNHLIVDFGANHSSSIAEPARQIQLTPSATTPGMDKKAAVKPLNSKSSKSAGTILSVEVEAQDQGTQVHFIGIGKPTRYKYFHLLNPPRFVIDLLDVQSSVRQKSWLLDSPWIEKIRLGTSYKDKVRIVFDLISEAKPPYNFFTGDNQFIVAFGTGSSVGSFDHNPEVHQAPDSSSTQTVDNVQSILPQIEPEHEQHEKRQSQKDPTDDMKGVKGKR